MAKKILFAEGGGVDGLKALHTSDKEGLGVVFEDEYDRVYRYVKNAGATALQASGWCFKKLGATTAKGAIQRVLPPDAATGPTTCMPSLIAGVPMTGIGASGSSTGDHGWVQIKGPARISIAQAATDTQQEAGCVAIGTGVTFAAAHVWAVAASQVIDTVAANGTLFFNYARLASSLATTGAATAASAVANINCMN